MILTNQSRQEATSLGDKWRSKVGKSRLQYVSQLPREVTNDPTICVPSPYFFSFSFFLLCFSLPSVSPSFSFCFSFLLLLFLLSSFPNSSHSFLLHSVLNNRVTIAEVQLYGDVVLRYVSYKDLAQLYDPNPDSWFLPRFESVPSSFPLDFGFRRLDHAVGNVSNLNITFHGRFDILSAPDDGVGADPKRIHHLSR